MYTNQILDIIGSVIASVFATLIVSAYNGTMLVVHKYREGLSAIRNKTIIRWALDAGLAGNAKARTRYDRSRILCKSDVPGWAMRQIQELIDKLEREPIANSSANWISIELVANLTHQNLVHEVRKIEKRLKKLLWAPASHTPKVKSWKQGYTKATQRIQDLIDRYKSRGRLVAIARMHYDLIVATQHRLILFGQLFDRVIPILCASIWLEDFLSLHPCLLEEHEKLAMINNCSDDPWQLQEHPNIRWILEAEGELGELFQRYGITTEERAKAVRKLMRSTITKSSLRKVSEWVISLRPPAPSATPKLVSPLPQTVSTAPNVKPISPAPPLNRREAVKLFARGKCSLTRTEQNQIMHLIIKLDNEGLANVSELIDQLVNHPADDLLSHLELRYHELTATIIELEEPTRVIRPTVLPKLPPEETPEELLDRLLSANRIGHSDTLRLRVLINRNQIPSHRLEEALTHIICSRLAYGGSLSGIHRPYRIRLDSLSKLYSPPGLKSACDRVVEQLIGEDVIIHRQHATRRPEPKSPVKLSPKAMHKYHS